MGSVSYPIGDSEHGFVGVELDMNGSLLPGILRISYGDTLDHGEIADSTGQIAAYVRGQYKAKDVELEVRRSHWDAYVRQQPATWRLTSFNILVRRRTPGLDDYTDTLVGCRHKDVDGDGAVGSADGLTIKLTFVCRGVLWTGKLPFLGFRV